MSATIRCRECGQGFVVTGDQAREVPLVIPRHFRVTKWRVTGNGYEVPCEHSDKPCPGEAE